MKPFLLEPEVTNDIIEADKGCFVSNSNNSCFFLKHPSSTIPHGLCSARFIIISDNLIKPKIYFNYGKGFLEETAIVLLNVEKNIYTADFILKFRLIGMRLSLLNSDGAFQLKELRFELHNELFYTIKNFIAISYNDFKDTHKFSRIFKKSFARYKKEGRSKMLEKLEKEYNKINLKLNQKTYYAKKSLPDNTTLNYEIINDLIEIQNFLKLNDENTISKRTIRETIIPQIIKTIRNNYSKNSFKGSILYDSNSVKVLFDKIESVIDIVIPVYRDIAITKECIESVLNAKSMLDFHIIIVNDKSPEENMYEMLIEYSKISNITLITNHTNVGFVESVNAGMHLHNRDVILLNSDTIVSDYWIDKLFKSAYTDATIATATPISNSATILSYPITLEDNKLPDGLTASEIDKIAEKVNKNIIVDLPTAHGFCMFIKRKAINEVGYFDAAKFGKGYGEENDFSLRVATRGWRNIAVCDTFVQHIGSVSFSDKKDQYIKNNLKILNNIYPEYGTSVMNFIQNDSLLGARRNITKELYLKNNSESMLFITHNLGGGTQVATEKLIDLLKVESIGVYELRQIDSYYILNKTGFSYSLEYKLAEWQLLIKDLHDFKILNIHYHHIAEFDWNIFELPSLLKISYDFTIHDYMPICPRINLINAKYEYCGEPSADLCNICLRENGANPLLLDKYFKIDYNIEKWRLKFDSFLKEARRVYLPNEDIKIRLSKYFTLDNFYVMPHPETKQVIEINYSKTEKDTPVKVAIIGAIGNIKGYERLYDCAKYSYENKLSIEFVVIGYTMNDEKLNYFNNVEITGKYKESDLSSLIRKHDCSIALFLSTCPETYSYTFSEAISNSLIPISYDIGAVAHRSKTLDIGELLPLEASAKELAKKILMLGSTATNKTVVVGKEYETILSDYYKLKINDAR